MKTILLLTVIGIILVTVGLTGLYFDVRARLKAINKELRAHESEISAHKKDIRIIKERAATESDRVIICHESAASGVKFPNEEGL
jgi:hypothetical protein